MALLVKRVHYSRRKPAAILVQLLAPLVVILLCLSISHYNQSAPDPPNLVMQPSMFFAVNQYNYMFLGGLNDSKSAVAASSLLRPCGLGAEILDSSTESTSQCYYRRHSDACTGYPDYHRPSNSCWCDCNWSPPIEQPICYNGTVVSTPSLLSHHHYYHTLTITPSLLSHHHYYHIVTDWQQSPGPHAANI